VNSNYLDCQKSQTSKLVHYSFVAFQHALKVHPDFVPTTHFVPHFVLRLSVEGSALSARRLREGLLAPQQSGGQVLALQTNL